MFVCQHLRTMRVKLRSTEEPITDVLMQPVFNQSGSLDLANLLVESSSQAGLFRIVKTDRSPLEDVLGQMNDSPCIILLVVRCDMIEGCQHRDVQLVKTLLSKHFKAVTVVIRNYGGPKTSDLLVSNLKSNSTQRTFA